MNKTTIVLAGEGGQGIQTIALIFAATATDNGYEVTYIPSFGVEQRGAPSVTYITISKDPILCPDIEIADYVVVLRARAIQSIESFISPSTKVIFDSSTVSASELPNLAVHLYGIPATKYANEKFNPKSFNLIILGYLAQIFNLPKDSIWKKIELTLGAKFKTKEIREESKEAFLFGLDVVSERKDFIEASYKTRHTSVLVKGHGKHGEIVPNRCKGCGICIAKCPVGALSFSQDLGVLSTPIPQVDLEKCIACGNCRAFCPDGAISIEKDKI